MALGYAGAAGMLGRAGTPPDDPPIDGLWAEASPTPARKMAVLSNSFCLIWMILSFPLVLLIPHPRAPIAVVISKLGFEANKRYATRFRCKSICLFLIPVIHLIFTFGENCSRARTQMHPAVEEPLSY